VRWMEEWGAAVYRVEFVDADGAPLLEALTRRERTSYAAPPLLREKAGDARTVQWRVAALDANGTVLKRSGWRVLRFDAKTEP
jgi:hypothetical protein